MTRLVVVAALVLAVPSFGAVALAQTEEAPSEESPAEEVEIPAGQEPVVIISETDEAPEEEAWTFRFLVPTVLMLAAVVLLPLFLAYGLRVRGRYRVAR